MIPNQYSRRTFLNHGLTGLGGLALGRLLLNDRAGAVEAVSSDGMGYRRRHSRHSVHLHPARLLTGRRGMVRRRVDQLGPRQEGHRRRHLRSYLGRFDRRAGGPRAPDAAVLR